MGVGDDIIGVPSQPCENWLGDKAFAKAFKYTKTKRWAGEKREGSPPTQPTREIQY